MKSKRNKIVATIILLAALTALSLIYAKKLKVGKEADTISPRAQEFIEKEYPNFRDNALEDNSGQIFNTACFGLALPYNSLNQKTESQEETCVFRARILSPNAQLVITSTQYQDTLAAHSSVATRRTQIDVYKETKHEIEGYEEALRFDEQTGVVYFLKKGTTLLTIAFSNLASPTNILHKDVLKLVSNIIFIN